MWLTDQWNRIYRWSLLDDCRTWAGHSLLACIIALVGGVIMWYFADTPWAISMVVGVALGIWTYVVREVAEILGYMWTARRKKFDHMMDVMCPALALQFLFRAVTEWIPKLLS